MGLDDIEVVDFVGLERDTGIVVLTIADAWDWSDETAHLVALQAKVYRYLDFIESGQLIETEPDAAGRPIRIDLLSRLPISSRGAEFVAFARDVAASEGVALEYRHVPGSLSSPESTALRIDRTDPRGPS